MSIYGVFIKCYYKGDAGCDTQMADAFVSPQLFTAESDALAEFDRQRDCYKADPGYKPEMSIDVNRTGRNDIICASKFEETKYGFRVVIYVQRLYLHEG